MKYILILFALFSFISCSNYTNKNSGRLIIDENLTNPFFEYSHIGVTGGVDSVYIDSVLVYSNNSVVGREIVSNADVRELNQKLPRLDFCNSFFSRDTLVIEIKSTMKAFTSKIKIKVIDKKYNAYFIRANLSNEYLATPVSLKFRKRIDKKGQEIFGVLAIKYLDSKNNLEYSFNGPFTCVVE